MFDPARITVGTTPVRLTKTGPGSLDGFALAVQAPADTVIYLGGSDVTTSNGWPLPAGSREAYDLEIGEAVYAVVASGSTTVTVLRTGA